MKFPILSLMGLITLASGDDSRLLKRRTRTPRVHKTDIIAGLETMVAKLQADLTAVSSKLATSVASGASLNATVASLQANVTASMSTISTLKTQVSTCNASLSVSFTADQVTTTVYNQLVNEYAYDVFNASTPALYRTLSRLSNGNNAKNYESAGGLIWNAYNPEAAFFLANSDDDTLVREMQVRVAVITALHVIYFSCFSSHLLLACTMSITGTCFQVSCSWK